jgi:hypothetical protein
LADGKGVRRRDVRVLLRSSGNEGKPGTKDDPPVAVAIQVEMTFALK